MSGFLYDWHPILLVVGVVLAVLVVAFLVTWRTDREVARDQYDRARRVIDQYRLPQDITWGEVLDIEEAERDQRRAEGRAAARRIVAGDR